MKINFKDIIKFVIVFLIIFAIQLIVKPCEVKADIFYPDFISTQLYYGNGHIANSTSKNTFGNFTDYQFPEISVITPWTVNLGFNYTFPQKAQYFYFYGYSNISINGAFLYGSDYCENIVNSSSDFPTNDSSEPNVQSLIPFGFKCNISHTRNDYYINLLGNAVVQTSVTMAPRIFIHNRFFYDVDNNTSTIENYIQQDIEYSKEQIQKQEETNQAIKDTNDTIKDSNTDEAQSSANGFFSGFDNNDHGLSGIISAPIRLVQTFNATTCTPVKFSIWGKESELPCGSYMYDRPDVKPFINVYNIIVGGLICYGCVRGIYKKVEDFKNPDDSKVEVLDL